MKILILAALTAALLAAATPAAANRSWVPPYGGPMVTAAHDRVIAQQRDSDCDNCACLSPDGDHDCDDRVGVPEPATLVLLASGVGGLVFIWRRRRR